MSIQHLPVFGICGHSGSGKTTLIEQLLPRLRSRGLRVAVIKHSTHHVNVDTPGKDSDRFYNAGADVLLQGPDQSFLRSHQGGQTGLAGVVETLADAYDLVLIEGHKNYDAPKIWLLSEGPQLPPANLTEVAGVLSWSSERLPAALEILERFLQERCRQTPVLGCVLIGGKSTRMGRPKHLLAQDRKTWLELIVDRLAQVTQNVCIVGNGDLPEGLRLHVRLPDVPGVAGPLAGLLAAMRWAPRASWLVAACDLPRLSVEALQWILSTRQPGVWATIPACPGPDDLQPLLAHYDFRSRLLLEEMAAGGNARLHSIASYPNVARPLVPQELVSAWTNVNTAPELKSIADNI